MSAEIKRRVEKPERELASASVPSLALPYDASKLAEAKELFQRMALLTEQAEYLSKMSKASGQAGFENSLKDVNSTLNKLSPLFRTLRDDKALAEQMDVAAACEAIVKAKVAGALLAETELKKHSDNIKAAEAERGFISSLASRTLDNLLEAAKYAARIPQLAYVTLKAVYLAGRGIKHSLEEGQNFNASYKQGINEAAEFIEDNRRYCNENIFGGSIWGSDQEFINEGVFSTVLIRLNPAFYASSGFISPVTSLARIIAEEGVRSIYTRDGRKISVEDLLNDKNDPALRWLRRGCALVEISGGLLAIVATGGASGGSIAGTLIRSLGCSAVLGLGGAIADELDSQRGFSAESFRELADSTLQHMGSSVSVHGTMSVLRYSWISKSCNSFPRAQTLARLKAGCTVGEGLKISSTELRQYAKYLSALKQVQKISAVIDLSDALSDAGQTLADLGDRAQQKNARSLSASLLRCGISALDAKDVSLVLDSKNKGNPFQAQGSLTKEEKLKLGATKVEGSLNKAAKRDFAVLYLSKADLKRWCEENSESFVNVKSKEEIANCQAAYIPEKNLIIAVKPNSLGEERAEALRALRHEFEHVKQKRKGVDPLSLSSEKEAHITADSWATNNLGLEPRPWARQAKLYKEPASSGLPQLKLAAAQSEKPRKLTEPDIINLLKTPPEGLSLEDIIRGLLNKKYSKEILKDFLLSPPPSLDSDSISKVLLNEEPKFLLEIARTPTTSRLKIAKKIEYATKLIAEEKLVYEILADLPQISDKLAERISLLGKISEVLEVGDPALIAAIERELSNSTNQDLDSGTMLADNSLGADLRKPEALRAILQSSRLHLWGPLLSKLGQEMKRTLDDSKNISPPLAHGPYLDLCLRIALMEEPYLKNIKEALFLNIDWLKDLAERCKSRNLGLEETVLLFKENILPLIPGTYLQANTSLANYQALEPALRRYITDFGLRPCDQAFDRYRKIKSKYDPNGEPHEQTRLAILAETYLKRQALLCGEREQIEALFKEQELTEPELRAKYPELALLFPEGWSITEMRAAFEKLYDWSKKDNAPEQGPALSWEHSRENIGGACNTLLYTYPPELAASVYALLEAKLPDNAQAQSCQAVFNTRTGQCLGVYILNRKNQPQFITAAPRVDENIFTALRKTLEPTAEPETSASKRLDYLSPGKTPATKALVELADKDPWELCSILTSSPVQSPERLWIIFKTLHNLVNETSYQDNPYTPAALKALTTAVFSPAFLRSLTMAEDNVRFGILSRIEKASDRLQNAFSAEELFYLLERRNFQHYILMLHLRTLEDILPEAVQYFDYMLEVGTRNSYLDHMVSFPPTDNPANCPWAIISRNIRRVKLEPGPARFEKTLEGFLELCGAEEFPEIWRCLIEHNLDYTTPQATDRNSEQDEADWWKHGRQAPTSSYEEQQSQPQPEEQTLTELDTLLRVRAIALGLDRLLVLANTSAEDNWWKHFEGNNPLHLEILRSTLTPEVSEEAVSEALRFSSENTISQKKGLGKELENPVRLSNQFAVSHPRHAASRALALLRAWGEELWSARSKFRSAVINSPNVFFVQLFDTKASRLRNTYKSTNFNPYLGQFIKLKLSFANRANQSSIYLFLSPAKWKGATPVDEAKIFKDYKSLLHPSTASICLHYSPKSDSEGNTRKEPFDLDTRELSQESLELLQNFGIEIPSDGYLQLSEIRGS